MKITALSSSFRERIPFHRSEAYRTPESSGCYVLANINDEILYIGKSVSLVRRIDDHLNDSRMTSLTVGGLAVWFYYVVLKPAEIDNAEERLLFKYKATEGKLPPLNRIGP